VDQDLDILDREVQSRLCGECFGDVDGGEGGVEGEVKAVGVASLAVVESSELLCVAVDELYLKARVSFGFVGQAGVERHPVELFLEVLAEAALARLAKPRHLAEVDASRYEKVTKHGLDEELFERFM